MRLGRLHASGATSVTSGGVRVLEGIKPVAITVEVCRKRGRV